MVDTQRFTIFSRFLVGGQRLLRLIVSFRLVSRLTSPNGRDSTYSIDEWEDDVAKMPSHIFIPSEINLYQS
jgi:hypothetical protein